MASCNVCLIICLWNLQKYFVGIVKLFFSDPEHTDEYLALLGSHDSRSDISDDEGWPTHSIQPAQLFPDVDLPVDESDEEVERVVQETQEPSSSSDDAGSSQSPSSSQQTKRRTSSDAAGSSQSPSSSQRTQRTSNARPHTYNRNINFRRNFPFVSNNPPGPCASTVLDPYEYFESYLSDEIWNELTLFVHSRSTCQRRVNPWNLQLMMLKKIVGITFYVSILDIPKMVMYWQKETKISCIANAMPRDLYGKIRSNLKVVDDSKVTPAQKKGR